MPTIKAEEDNEQSYEVAAVEACIRLLQALRASGDIPERSADALAPGGAPGQEEIDPVELTASLKEFAKLL